MPLITIDTSQIDASNSLVESLAARMGKDPTTLSAELVTLLLQIAAAPTTDDSDVIMTSSEPHSKKRKLCSGISCVVDVALQPSTFKLQRPVTVAHAAKPMDYTIFPQHIILYIFEFVLVSINNEQALGRLFCRFRSQSIERQYFLQYRSLCIRDSTIRTLTQKKSIAFKILMRQAIRLELHFGVRSWHAVATLFTQQNWPQLQSVELVAADQDRGFEDVVSKAQNPQYLLDRIVALQDDKRKTKAAVASIVAMLPQLEQLNKIRINSDAIAEFGNAKYLSSVTVHDCSENDAIELLKKMSTLKNISYRVPSTGEAWSKFSTVVSKLSTTASLKSLAITNVISVPVVPSLIQLRINSPYHVFNFNGIERILHLQRLELFFSIRQGLVSCQCLTLCRELTHLSITFQSQAPTTELAAAIKQLNARGQFKELKLENIPSMDDRLPAVSLTELGIGEQCALRKLSIVGFSVLDPNVSSQSCIESCNHLDYICVSGLHTCLLYESETSA